jgi:deoxyribodipyrimidine photolyase-related protein
MGTYAIGDLMTTKPYVSGTPYIYKMTDFCGFCVFDSKKNGPISRLYWVFLSRHATALKKSTDETSHGYSKKRSKNDRSKDEKTSERVQNFLLSGERLTPEKLV